MKLNKKGFTLIELLAVITIMGILLLVAIPAVSRTIENTRRDTFKDLAKTYINTVRNAIIADELDCGGKSVGATTAGSYYFLLGTDKDNFDAGKVSQTLDLMESGGKSSWGNNDVVGMVAWRKVANTDTGSGGHTEGFKTTYYAFIVDSANHGLDTLLEENSIVRSKILTNTAIKYADITNSSGATDSVSKLQGKIASLTDDGKNELKAAMNANLVFTGTDANMTECTLNS